MKRILVFAGTSEGRTFAEKALSLGFFVTLSVATEYGKEVVGEKLLCRPVADRLSLRVGRLSVDEMARLAADFDAVVDATHPFAVEVTDNIKKACASVKKPYFRLARSVAVGNSGGNPSDFYEFNTMEEIADFIVRTDAELDDFSRRIFVSTGAKELSPFTRICGFKSRVFVRVLPSAESIQKCEAHGFSKSRIIAMQGPFSAALNEAMFRETGAGILVTKMSGRNGGFCEKIAAAEKCGMTVLALRPPEETDAFSDMDGLLSVILGMKSSL